MKSGDNIFSKMRWVGLKLGSNFMNFEALDN
jgi:hypothetical protein